MTEENKQSAKITRDALIILRCPEGFEALSDALSRAFGSDIICDGALDDALNQAIHSFDGQLS